MERVAIVLRHVDSWRSIRQGVKLVVVSEPVVVDTVFLDEGACAVKRRDLAHVLQIDLIVQIQ